MFNIADIDKKFYMCPECAAGKHTNCNGIGMVDDDNNAWPCGCKGGSHPARQDILDGEGNLFHKADLSDASTRITAGTTFHVSQRYDVNTREILEEEYIMLPGLPTAGIDVVVIEPVNSADVELPPPAPENDPGVSATSFPELTPEADEGDWVSNYRVKPDRDLLRDLMDVEVLNDHGVWVPAVPLPIFEGFGICRCHCGKRRWGKKRYQEHYAYAHILGMES